MVVIMLQNSPSVYVDLDVHKESLAIALANPACGGKIRFYGNIPNHQQSINH